MRAKNIFLQITFCTVGFYTASNIFDKLLVAYDIPERLVDGIFFSGVMFGLVISFVSRIIDHFFTAPREGI